MNSYHIDNSLKPHKLTMNLYRMNRKTRLGEITDARNITLRIKFSGVHELTFTVPFDSISKNKRVRNPRVDELKENFKIKIKYGDIEEWFVITKKKKVMDDGNSLQIQCHSLAHELNFQYLIDYEAKSSNCLMALSDALKTTNWSVGYINPDFLLQWRQFDISSQTILTFIDDLCETFKGVAIYDTINREVNIYKEDEISTYKGFIIEYGQYLSSLEDEIEVNSIKTRLIVSDNGEASINAANPTGQNYIDDFSVYLYPFERDENKNVIRHSAYLEDDVCHAILDYNEKVNEHQFDFEEYLKMKKRYRAEKTVFENEKQILDDDLKIIDDDIAVAKKTNQSTTVLMNQRNAKQLEVDNKKAQIDSVQAKIDEVDKNIQILNELLKFENNFKGDILEEVNDIINVEVWTDSNHIDDESYYYAAVDYLSERAILPVNLTLNIINFFEIMSEHKNWKRMSIGDIVRIRHKKLNIDVKTKISEIEFNIDSNSINLTISNTKRPENQLIQMANFMYRQQKMNIDIEKRKPSWIAATNNFNTRNDRNSSIPTNPTIKSLTHKLNDNGSVDLTLTWDYPDSTKTGKPADDIDGFKLFIFADTTSEKHFFGSNLDEKSAYEVTHSSRTFTFSNVTANHYYTLGIQAYRSVDEDIDKGGILFSGMVSTGQPYQPTQTIQVNGKLTGLVNETLQLALPDKPDATLYPGQKVLYTNTTDGKVYYKSQTDTEFKQTSTGNASSVGGLSPSKDSLPNTIPVRNQYGSLDTNITGDAQSVDGYSSEYLLTVYDMGVANGVVPLNSQNKIDSTYLPTASGNSTIKTGVYTGDGKLSKTISIGFTPSLVKIYTTNSTDQTLYIPSTLGGFTMKSLNGNSYLNGTNNAPALEYGKLINNGFVTGSSAETLGNKLNVKYYYEAIL